MTRTRKLGPDLTVKLFEDASGGWGSVKTPCPAWRETGRPFTGSRVILKQNKADCFSASVAHGQSQRSRGFVSFAKMEPRRPLGK